eukprot:6266025-Alexandrium_andersonii.AAC.1
MPRAVLNAFDAAWNVSDRFGAPSGAVASTVGRSPKLPETARSGKARNYPQLPESVETTRNSPEQFQAASKLSNTALGVSSWTRWLVRG